MRSSVLACGQRRVASLTYALDDEAARGAVLLRFGVSPWSLWTRRFSFLGRFPSSVSWFGDRGLSLREKP